MMSNPILLQLGDILGFLLILLAIIAAGIILLIAAFGGGIYGIYKLLFSDEYQDTRDSASQVASETGRALNDFANSPEGQATLSVLETVAKQYENSDQYGDATSSASNSIGPPSGGDQLDRSQMNDLETAIRNQGVDPHESSHDTDIDELLKDIEQDGSDWK